MLDGLPHCEPVLSGSHTKIELNTGPACRNASIAVLTTHLLRVMQ